MTIERIHSFLVQPGKHAEDQAEISGTRVHLGAPLTLMLERVFDCAVLECDIEIVFQHDDHGRPKNACRDLVVEYVASPSIGNGRAIAGRLQEVTTRRSGLGLLFLIKGVVDGEQRIVMARFPADQGVIAEEHAERLSVTFIERVFMKSARAYKAVVYSSDSLARGFWEGRAVDRQISGPREFSDYWIREFLASELRTTGPAGTMRFASAIRAAVRATDQLDLSHELIAAAQLLVGQRGRRESARQIIERLGVSHEAGSAIEDAFPRPDLMDEVFEFDAEEFRRHAPYRTVELDNGALLVAENERFREVFREQILNVAERRVRYMTEGRVVEEKLRKSK